MGLQVVCFPIFVGYKCILQYTFDFLLVITRISSVFPWLFAIVAMCSPEISPYLDFWKSWKCGIPKIKDIKNKENYDEKVCPDFYKQHKSQLHCWTIYMPLGYPSRFRMIFFAHIFILIHYIYIYYISDDITHITGVLKKGCGPLASPGMHPNVLFQVVELLFLTPPKKHSPTFGQFTLW